MTRPAGRAGRLPRLLRAHGPGQRGRPCRPRPVPAAPRRRRRAAAAHRRGGVGGGPAGPPGVRRRARGRDAQLRPGRQLRHLPGLADPLGHAADPARRDPRAGRRAQRELVRIGIDRPAAAATGKPEEWAARPLASLRRPRSASLPTRRAWPTAPGTWSCWTCGGSSNGKTVTSRTRSTSRSATCPAGRARSRLVMSGCTATPATAPWSQRPLLAARGRHVVSIDDDFANAESAGLPIARPGGPPKEMPS